MRGEDQRFLHQQVATIGARREIGVRIDDAAAREADREILADDAHVVRIERQPLAIVGPRGGRSIGIESTPGVAARAGGYRAWRSRRS